MWPGDWKQQLHQLNQKITDTNMINAAAAGKRKQKINSVSEQEWWKFIGIIISAAPQGKGGVNLWEKDTHREGRSMTKTIDYGPDGE
jgi:hypothetical protein